MNIFKKIATDLESCSQELSIDPAIVQSCAIEVPKEAKYGDISTNLAMLISSKLKTSPRAIAEKIKAYMERLDYINSVEIAGPGFINFFIENWQWYKSLESILADEEDFWQVDIGKGEKINIEYVSANPTGPMHIGHARGAVYGDVLASLLSHCGYNVTKEYYVNDAGSQIDVLVNSLMIRYRELVSGQQLEVPDGFYPGSYLIDAAKELQQLQGNDLPNELSKEQARFVREFAISQMMKLIKEDLAQLGVEHEVFTYESRLHSENKIDQAVKKLQSQNLIYKGTLPPPKGKLDEEWQEKEQTLFRSTAYGDDQDRAICKNDGSWTYLAADFAYADDKIDRGFNTLIYILGADHGGYIKRIKAVISALSNNTVASDIRTCQLVNFVKNGNPLKMSKRQGNFLTVTDVTREVPKDIIRFIMLTRKNDMKLDFDFEKVKEQSKDNPVFYVQYAHVRAGSVIKNAQETMPDAYTAFTKHQYNPDKLYAEDLELLKLLASWPRMLQSAAIAKEPHRLAYYIIEVASKFHSIWSLGKSSINYRFSNIEDPETSAARLALCSAVAKIIASGLKIIGVEPMERM